MASKRHNKKDGVFRSTFVLIFLFASAICVEAKTNTKGVHCFITGDIGTTFCDGAVHKSFLRRIGVESGVGFRTDIPFDEKWSFIPGVGIHAEQTAWRSNPIMLQFDTFCSVGYNYKAGDKTVIISFGPNLSYVLVPTCYYIDADPTDLRNGKEIYNRLNVSARPEILIEGSGHWYHGFGMVIGLHNQHVQYDDFESYNSREHFFRIMVGFRL